MTSTEKSNNPGRAIGEIGIVIAISIAAFGAELVFAEHLPWGEEGRGVVSVLAGALTALILHRASGRGWQEFGFRRPARVVTVPLWVVAIVAAFLGAQAFAFGILGPIFDLPPPDMSRYDNIAGNLPAAITMGLLLPFTASIPEELLYRGFMMDRLQTVFSAQRLASVLSVLGQALIFGLIHFQWGVGGVIATMVMGLVWGIAYVLCGRNLWIVILAHSTAHVLFVMQLYSSTG